MQYSWANPINDYTFTICPGESLTLIGAETIFDCSPCIPNDSIDDIVSEEPPLINSFGSWSSENSLICSDCQEIVVAPTTTTTFTFINYYAPCPIMDEDGNCIPSGPVQLEEIAYHIIVEDDCETDSGNTPDFDEFTWLNDIVDLEDCCQNTTVTQYTNGAYSYIYIEADAACEDTYDMLYYNGTVYCDSEHFDCYDLYDLADFEAITLWECGEETETEEETDDHDPIPCDIEDPFAELDWTNELTNCDYQPIVFSLYCYDNELLVLAHYPFDVGVLDAGENLYYGDGTYICVNGTISGGDCYPMYSNLLNDSEYIATYDPCTQTCVCDDIDAPVCGEDGETYPNSCLAYCAGVEVVGEGDCETDSGNVPDFDEFPWLNDIVDLEDCCQNTTVTQYTNGAYSYIYIEADEDCDDVYDMLYYNGTAYCDSEHFDCYDLYDLNEFEAITLWECEEETEEETDEHEPISCDDIDDPFADISWLAENCGTSFFLDLYCYNGEIVIKERHPYDGVAHDQTPYYYGDGTLICIDGGIDGGSCDIAPDNFFEDLEYITTFNDCTEICDCPDTYNPVCSADGTTYDNGCIAYCLGVEVLSFGTCSVMGGNPDFGEFTWLNDIVDIDNCCDYAVVTEYTNGSYSFIYIEPDPSCSNEFPTLYYNGDKHCNGEHFDCFNIYDLDEFTANVLWDCNLGMGKPASEADNAFRLENKNDIDTFIAATINIYPNPTIDFLNIGTFGFNRDNTMVVITDYTGRIIKQVNATSPTLQIQTSDLATGGYLLHITDGKQSITEKFIKVE